MSGTTSASPGNDYIVFLRDMQTGQTFLVSHDLANDGQIRGSSGNISMSTDGRYVLFTSTDPNLTAERHQRRPNVFEWDSNSGRSRWSA